MTTTAAVPGDPCEPWCTELGQRDYHRGNCGARSGYFATSRGGRVAVDITQPRTNRRSVGQPYITASATVMDPAEARQMAALLLQAADMVSGFPDGKPEGSRQHRHPLIVVRGGVQ